MYMHTHLGRTECSDRLPCMLQEDLNVFNNVIGLSLPNEIGELTELQEVNLAANKLAVLKDLHFAKWSKVTILNLNDNNLTSMGSLAPLVSLEELRIFCNKLGALPVLASSVPALKIIEAHKNPMTGCGAADDSYFAATPALERLLMHSLTEGTPGITSVPSSITKCEKLQFLQVQDNPNLASLPDGPWPKTLMNLFVHGTKIGALPNSLKECNDLKTVNISGVGCEDALAAALEKIVLSKTGSIFTDKNGKMTRK